MSNIKQDLRKLAESIVPGLDNSEYQDIVDISTKRVGNISGLERISGTAKYETRLISAVIDALDASPNILNNDYISSDDINVIASMDQTLCGKFNIKICENNYLDPEDLQEEYYETNEDPELEYDPAARTYLETPYSNDTEWDAGDAWTLHDVRTEHALQKGNMLNDATKGAPRHTNDFSTAKG